MSALFTPGTTGFLILCLVALAVLINGWTFVVFGLDKRRAAAGAWRVPEQTLLLLALLGGWPGAKAAQRWFRHKTRKQPFGIVLNLIGGVQVLGIAALIVFAERGALPDLVQLAAALDGSGAAPPDKVLPRRFGPGSADW